MKWKKERGEDQIKMSHREFPVRESVKKQTEKKREREDSKITRGKYLRNT